MKCPRIIIHKATILNEKDCIKIKQKGWRDRKDWIEINDIVRVQGFSWLSNGKDSCWIRIADNGDSSRNGY